MPLCRPCSKDFIPEEYFKLFFSRNSHKTTTLDEVLDSSLLIKLLTNDADAILYVKRILHEVIICAGSIHGDFHIDNILHLDGKYYFIDIGSYRTNGSPYFDLIHYYIFENKENSWSCKAHQLLHSNISNLYGIDLSKKEIIGFIFHLISQDLQSAERTPERKKKYIALIKDCCLAYETMTTIQYS